MTPALIKTLMARTDLHRALAAHKGRGIIPQVTLDKAAVARIRDTLV